MNVSMVGRNVAAAYDVKTGKILLEIDTNAKGQTSASGKSTVYATTNGFVSLTCGEKTFRIGLNIIQ
jgi:hypothetical protein